MSTADYKVYVDWNNDGDYSDAGEDITSRVLGNRNAGVTFSYGRDHARAVEATRSGEASFDVNNESHDYSPDNGSSPLSGNLEPGRPVLIQATFNAVTYTLFRGFLDGYELKPSEKDVSMVDFTAIDALGRIRESRLSTPLHQSLTSGQAINALLDSVGWPEDDRDIDHGASVLRWWWEDDANGLDALNRILASEGPPAFAFIAPDGKFTFRDRHHRLTRTESKNIQATFRASGTEPLYSEPFEYSLGWRDLINQMVQDVEEREPTATKVVWESDEPIALVTGESRVLQIKTNDPFFDAITPIAGTEDDGADIIVASGSVNIVMSRDSGLSTEITITATAATLITKVAMRAKSVEVARKHRVSYQDDDSVEAHGVRTGDDKAIWANKNDAYAIAQIIVGQRKERLPVIHMTVKNANDTRLTNILDRDLSDRVHIVEATHTNTDHDYFIETISHKITKAGKLHEVEFGLERSVTEEIETPNFFTFDEAGKGFDQGLFGDGGVVRSDKLFILGDATLGKLNVSGLGY